MPPANPRVFISYSHDSRAHCDQVLELAQQLRRDGIAAELDQFHQEELLHWPRWCEEQMRLENADFVLCVCTAEYARRVEGKVAADVGKGVFWEGTLIYNELYDAKGNPHCVPVLLDGAADADIPRVLQNFNCLRLGQFALEDEGYGKLYRLLTRQPRLTGAELGATVQLPPLPEEERRTDFVGLIEDIHADLVKIRQDTLAIRRIIVAVLLALVIASLGVYWFVPERVAEKTQDVAKSFLADPVILRAKLEEQINKSFEAKLTELKSHKAPLAEIDQLYHLRDEKVKRLDETVAFIRATAKETQSSIVRKAAEILQERGVDAALEFLEKTRSKQGKRVKEEAHELAEAALFESELRGSKLDFDKAMQAIQQAIELDYRWWEPHNRLGLLALQLAQWDIAEKEFKEAEQFVEREEDQATVLNDLAQLMQDTNRLADAEQVMRDALAIDEKHFGPDHPNVARDLNNLAQLLQATNRLAEAEPLMRSALAIDEKSYGPEHPNVAIDINNLAQLLQATNRLTDAELLMREALAIDKKNLGPEHPKVATRINNLAQFLQNTDRLTEAEPLMREALEIDEKIFGPEHPNVAIDINNLAWLLKTTNRLSDAEPLMRRAVVIFEKNYGVEHPNVAIALNNLAALLQDTNRLADAEPLMRRALAIDEKSLGPEHTNVAHNLNNLATLMYAKNRLADAEPLMRRGLVIFLKSTRATGQELPGLQKVMDNYQQLLSKTGLTKKQTARRLAETAQLAGYSAEEWQKLLQPQP